MVELRMITRKKDGLGLSELGRDYLFRLCNGKKPQMIDIDSSAILPKKKKEFIVRSSLAAEIFREVRNGD